MNMIAKGRMGCVFVYVLISVYSPCSNSTARVVENDGVVGTLGLRSFPVATSQQERDEPPYKEAVELYRKCGLPFPPTDARLVRFEHGQSGGADGKMRPIIHLGFLLKKGTRGPVVLVGPSEIDYPFPGLAEIGPKEISAEQITPEFSFSYTPVLIGMNVGLATAIQCIDRGWREFGKSLFERSLQSDAGHPHSPYYQPEDLPPRTAVAFLAWAYYGNQIACPGTNLEGIKKRIDALIQAEPKLDTDYGRALIKSLEASIKPSKAEPGSPEAMIDELININGPYHLYKKGPDSSVMRLAERGFEVVPRLIEHLDDVRLTRSVVMGQNNSPPHHLLVGEVIGEMIQGFKGEEQSYEVQMNELMGCFISKEGARDWWVKASKVGEERYLRDNALPGDPKAFWPNRVIVHILSKRYPQHLSGVYKTILDKRPSMQSWPVAEAISGSTLPKEQKSDLLAYAAGNTIYDHSRAALFELIKCDKDRLVTLLNRTFDEIVKTPKGSKLPYPVGPYTILVIKADDPRLWESLKKTCKQVDVGIRFQFLAKIWYFRKRDAPLIPRLEFLLAFFEDTELRDPGYFRHITHLAPDVAPKFKNLEVRNFAAILAAYLLELEKKPKPEWNQDEWASFRDEVKAAISREVIH